MRLGDAEGVPRTWGKDWWCLVLREWTRWYVVVPGILLGIWAWGQWG